MRDRGGLRPSWTVCTGEVLRFQAGPNGKDGKPTAQHVTPLLAVRWASSSLPRRVWGYGYGTPFRTRFDEASPRCEPHVTHAAAYRGKDSNGAGACIWATGHDYDSQ